MRKVREHSVDETADDRGAPKTNKRREPLTLVIIGSAVLGCFVTLIAFFIWPTPYQYRQWGGHFIRVNRMTQQVCVFDNGEWSPIEKPKPPASYREPKNDATRTWQNDPIVPK